MSAFCPSFFYQLIENANLADDVIPLIRRFPLKQIDMRTKTNKAPINFPLPKDWEPITDESAVLDFGRKINHEVASNVMDELNVKFVHRIHYLVLNAIPSLGIQ